MSVILEFAKALTLWMFGKNIRICVTHQQTKRESSFVPMNSVQVNEQIDPWNKKICKVGPAASEFLEVLVIKLKISLVIRVRVRVEQWVTVTAYIIPSIVCIL